MTTQQKAYITLIKRPVGFIGALLAIIVTSPIILGTIVVLFFANKKGSLTPSPSPEGEGSKKHHWWNYVFFTQSRPGKNEKIFKVIKFKTMTDERDGEGELLPDAMRLTKVGKFIRATSMDELPQLFNILKGDMAFIGPRPLLVQYIPLYSPEQHRRHEVTPGMSGWAQVNGRNNISWAKKFELDVYYVDHISFWMDIRVFFTTVMKVLGRKDISHEGQATMEVFNGNN